MFGFRRVDDVELFFPEDAQRIYRMRTACILLLFALAALATVNVVGLLRARSEAVKHRNDLVRRAENFTASTADDLADYFDEVRRAEIHEAIPMAILYATQPERRDGWTQWPVVAARRYLRGFDAREIESAIAEAEAKLRANGVDPGLARSTFREVLR